MVMSNHSYLSVNQVNIFNFQEPDCFFCLVMTFQNVRSGVGFFLLVPYLVYIIVADISQKKAAISGYHWRQNEGSYPRLDFSLILLSLLEHVCK